MTNKVWRAAGMILATCFFYVAASGASELAFKSAANKPIITFTRVHGMVRGVDDTPLLRVYGDGLVRVHIPSYMKGAGRYEYRLDDAALRGLVAEMDARGIMNFDRRAAMARRDATDAARQTGSGERFVTLDSTTTRIELNFAEFGAAGNALQRTVEWPDVGIDAERYPQLDAVTGLAAAERSLLALTDHPQRRAIKPPAGE